MSLKNPKLIYFYFLANNISNRNLGQPFVLPVLPYLEVSNDVYEK